MLMSDLITNQESCMSLAGNNSAFFLDQERKIPGNPSVKFQKYFRGGNHKETNPYIFQRFLNLKAGL
jgi:hypothetical protein